MFKRYIILIPVIVLILGIHSPYALADSIIPPELQVEANKAGINTEGLTILEIKTKISETSKNGAANNLVNVIAKTDGVKANQTEINPEIQDRAQKAGINTTGLTNLDVKIKLQEAWNAEFREKAKKYSIDITNLSDEQVREQVLTIENADAIAKAKKAGIKTDGLTYSQVMAGIEEWDRENARNNFGINTDGLTYSQVITAVQERVKEMTKKKEGSVNNENSNKNEQLMNDLIISAKALGIEYNGLSYEELYEKVIAAKKASIK